MISKNPKVRRRRGWLIKPNWILFIALVFVVSLVGIAAGVAYSITKVVFAVATVQFAIIDAHLSAVLMAFFAVMLVMSLLWLANRITVSGLCFGGAGWLGLIQVGERLADWLDVLGGK